MAGETQSSDAVFRSQLAKWLVWGASLGVITLSIIVIWTAKEDKRYEAAQMILTAVLPLLGTWVGTVLAFYYTKENFEAANRGTLEALKSVSPRLTTTRVADKMMRLASIFRITIPTGKQLKDVTLQAVNDEFEKVGASGQKMSRVIFVDDKGVCAAILHRSIWMEMLNMGAKLTPPVDVTKDDLGKLLPLAYESRAGKTFEEFVTRTIAHIGEDRTVADAKAAMEAKPNCQDVIVTATGKETEPMVGWISNVDITRLSQAT